MLIFVSGKHFLQSLFHGFEDSLPYFAVSIRTNKSPSPPKKKKKKKEELELVLMEFDATQ